MPKIMSTYARSLSLALLVSLYGVSHAAESPFFIGSDPGLQIAVRVISDEPPVEQGRPPADDAEAEGSPVPTPSLEDSAEQTGEGTPSTQASDTPPPQGDLPEDLGLSDQEEGNQDLAGQERAGEAEDSGLEDEFERDPELAGQGTLEEERERNLVRAEAILNRVDQILLDARAQARREREGRGDGDGTDESAQDEDLPAWETQDDDEGEIVEEETERGGVAEGQVPGDVPTGKTRPSRGYDRDDDIVTRQVCELAEREEDPEVRKHLEEKCESLRKG